MAISKPIRELSEQELRKLVQENEHIYTQHIDLDYAMSLERNIFDHLNKHYFRSQFIGFENYPTRNQKDKPLIFISNHSGMAFPWDAMVMGAGIFKLTGHNMYHAVRALVAPMLSQSTLMNPYLIPNFWKKAGGIDATALNFETMMQLNLANVLIYPEGVPGIGKGFNRKYQLQPFSTSFIRMALKYQTDIVPILTINGEYINPWSYSFPSINKLSRKIGIPFLPISFVLLLLPFQPWLFFFAFPARLTYVLGERIKVYEMIDKPYSEVTEEDIKMLRNQVRAAMQKDLDKAVTEYGKEPFKPWELIKNNLKDLRHIVFSFSPGWALLFMEHERLYKKRGDHKVAQMNLNYLSFWRVLFYNPFLICYFIPILGWIPILIKGYWGNKIDSENMSVPK